jgi:hypothetical protein
MQDLQAVSLGVRFATGAVLGVPLGLGLSLMALLRRGRPVHHAGVMVRGSARALHPDLAARLVGPVWVRFSGAFADQRTAGRDVLGVLLRFRSGAPSDDLRLGQQDLLLGTFESFHTAMRDRAATDTSDYLGNGYSSVTPWWLAGAGPATLRLAASGSRVAEGRRPASVADAGDAAGERDAGALRLDNLAAAVREGRATLTLSAQRGSTVIPLAEIRLDEVLGDDGARLRGSMFRCGGGLRPVGFRNGLRATVYPLSQWGRSLRAS